MLVRNLQVKMTCKRIYKNVSKAKNVKNGLENILLLIASDTAK